MSLSAQERLSEQFLPIIREKLSKKRYQHSLYVADRALEYAKIYGEDTEKAYTAGVLHDILKEEENSKLLQIIDDVGIILTPTERNSSSVWHAFASAVYVRDTICIKDDDIISAIMYHTTGRSKMSLLEKIIYIADYTSQDRNYETAKKAYKIAVSDINEAILFALSTTISCLASRREAICEKTIDAYNELTQIKAKI